MISSLAVAAVSVIVNATASVVTVATTPLATPSEFLWAEIGPKKALVCKLQQLEPCLNNLPASVRSQLPPASYQFHALLAQRGAMVLPLHDASIAGLVITDFANIPKYQTINWGVGHFSLALDKQAELTYWHELGHLYAIDALSRPDKTITNPYQHEWLADVYLVWRIAHETNRLDLAWQQYHRRNLAAMADSEFMSHWSVPVLAQILATYSVAQLQQFSDFNGFWQDFSGKLVLHDNDTLDEFSSLMQRTFGAGTVQPLPGYMYWRKPKLGQYLKPTLVRIMGRSAAQSWLAEQLMAGETEVEHY